MMMIIVVVLVAAAAAATVVIVIVVVAVLGWSENESKKSVNEGLKHHSFFECLFSFANSAFALTRWVRIRRETFLSTPVL